MIAAVLAVALAQQPVSNPKLAAAIDTFERGEFDAALDRLARLLDEPGLSNAQRATVRLYSAASWFQLGKPDFARAQLALAIELDPSVKPDLARFPPGLVALYAEESARLPKRSDEKPAPTPKPVEPRTKPDVGPELQSPPVVVEDEPPPRRFGGWWVPGLVGLIAGAWGGYFLAVADSEWKVLNTMQPPYPDVEEARAARNDGPLHLGIGIGAVAIGAVGLVASAVLFRLHRSSTTEVSVAPLASGGASVTLRRAW